MNPYRIQALSVASVLFLLDRTSKLWIEANVSLVDTLEVIPGVFNIVHARNPGAAFGFLASASKPVRLFFLVGVSLGILAFIASMLWQATNALAPAHARYRLALSCILGGAVGNLYDRIVRGSVTDFIQVFLGSYEWPSFNVADSAITVGASLMALDLLLNRKPANAPETS
jgi:signal peptidase II